MSKKGVLSTMPDFNKDTKVFYRGESGYAENSYQYATSSFDGMTPSAIIYPSSKDDILKVIHFASTNDIGIAVRTGGHQYSGHSSTSGENIQVDVSRTFANESEDFVYQESSNLLKVGVSFSLLKMNTLMAARGMFVPTGICSHVHLGGHVQTGGYGIVARSFGLTCDYVEGFEIILADGSIHTIWKPKSSLATKDELMEGNDDLFWAAMGGSPGNYGILTHVLFRPLHDKDYPDSRMMKAVTNYSPEKHYQCEQLLAEMSNDVNFPRNWDYGITIATDRSLYFDSKDVFEEKQKKTFDGNLNLDEKMSYQYPEQYGHGVPWAEKGEGPFGQFGEMPLQPPKYPNILIYLKWANVNGSDENFGQEEIKWFKKVREAMGGEGQITDFPTLEILKHDFKGTMVEYFKAALSFPDAKPYPKVDYLEPTPMSQQIRLFMYDPVREFNQPYIKRTYITEKTDLSTNGYAKWVSQRVAEIVEMAELSNYKVNLTHQAFFSGGIESMYAKFGLNYPERTCHSWRDELVQMLVLDGFYDPKDEEAFQFIQKWTEKNDKCIKEGDQGGEEAGIYSNFDRRFLWATFSKTSDKSGGLVLDDIWYKYFDSKQKYEKLIEIKRRFDPNYIFTANGFGVDASNAPTGRKVAITEKTVEKIDSQDY